MSTPGDVLIAPRDIPIVQTDLYTAVGVKAVMDALTATNTTAVAVTVSLNIVPPGGTVGDSNAIVKTVSILAGASYTFPELRLHRLLPGYKISGIASAVGVNLYVSGRITSP